MNSRDVAGERRDARRLLGIGRIVAQHEAVILDLRAAARGVDDDGVEPAALDLALPGVDVGAAHRRAPAPPCPCDGRARRSSRRPSATTTSQPCRVSSRTVASLISGASTGWAQPVSSATRFRRVPSAGNDLRPIDRRRRRRRATARGAASRASGAGQEPGASGRASAAPSSARRNRPGRGSTSASRRRSSRSGSGRG